MEKVTKKKKGAKRLKDSVENLDWAEGQRFDRIKYTLTALVILGLILQLFQTSLYAQTVISWKIPVAIWLCAGILGMNYVRKSLFKHYNTREILLHLFSATIGIGSITTYTFMAANYYLPANSKLETLKARISETGHQPRKRGSCGAPYAYVNIKGTQKQLTFPCDFNIKEFNFVIVKLRHGILGFDRIVEKTPIR